MEILVYLIVIAFALALIPVLREEDSKIRAAKALKSSQGLQATHMPLTKELLDVFGLKDVIKFDLKLRVNSLIVVETEFIVKDVQLQKLNTILRDYHLVRRDEIKDEK